MFFWENEKIYFSFIANFAFRGFIHFMNLTLVTLILSKLQLRMVESHELTDPQISFLIRGLGMATWYRTVDHFKYKTLSVLLLWAIHK